MPTPIDPTSLGFLLAENRNQPMHVAGLQLFEKPADAGPHFARELYEAALDTEEIAPLFRKRPSRSISSLGQWVWTDDAEFDIEHHVRHSALPEPGRIRELLELVSRLHGQMLGRERPLWEAHIIEGLADGRVAMYTKLHHSLVDGISAMKLMQSVLSTDPDRRNMPLPFDARAVRSKKVREPSARDLTSVPMDTLRSAMGLAADAGGLPAALIRTLNKGVKNEASALSFYAPKSIFNVNITGSRRFASDGWALDRLRAISKASRTTLNDVVLAMCGGAVRNYLIELNSLPDTSLVSMVPVGLKSRGSDSEAGGGGNAVGSVMVKLGTDLADPADRLAAIHASMKAGKAALESMTPNQIVAMSALGMAPSLAIPMLRLNGVVRPPFNLIISNVPGPRSTQFLNGARLTGTYPVSIPMQGMALNITCNSYAEDMCFGLTGDRRRVPHLQRLLVHLDSELTALEQAVGA
ncbi:wax ester/triacylglycerol synthase family O-acyltransferase [Nocardioides marmoriginsengisoli]|uniref:Diacylglycerol O-acyltransferase n=1 Tax=Nocardioides marmoriginsengisoli TaxID=661483 RepID=A0A3N0CL82_9ACTN|nr:wax ester/triacylglycerol synthase family O-acyltransferase [Nocardioides marmoriginsengisoli]RNL64215.1 wax ester/triacylglycerol synthase family O-acyltransferase [Nocardioides marmoriginsengisoli]